MELTIYTQTKDTTTKIYCEDCKPQGTSQRGTLVVGGWDHFCNGCGKDFREIAEGRQPSHLAISEEALRDLRRARGIE